MKLEPDEHVGVTVAIMTAVVIMIVAVLLMGSTPAHACLDRDRAARTWPTKQLAIDGDGCFTYMRRGMKPAPPEEVPVPVAVATPPDVDLETVKLDMLQRWPVVIDIPPKPRVVEVEPMMTPRTVVSVIMVVALFCALMEVAFGGMTGWKALKTGPKRPESR